MGLALVVLPAIPLPTWVAAADSGPIWTPHVLAWAIGVPVVVVGGLLAARLCARVRPGMVPRLPVRLWVLVGGLAIAVTGASLYAMLGVFAGNPHLVDEIAQLFHARVLVSGRLAAPAPQPPEFFLLTHTFISQGGWVSQYPPGHAALLAVGMRFGAEWLVNPLMGGLGVVFMYVIGKGLYDPKTGLAAAVLWALSAWVMFMSGTYMNHATATTLILGSWAALLGPRTPGRWAYLAAGCAMAAAAVTRPLDAVAGAVPLLVWIGMRRQWRVLPWLALGGAPILVALAYTNWRLFGNPLTLGYSAMYGEAHGLGFHEDPYGEPFTPLVALSNLAAAIRRLYIYLYEWPIPALLPLVVWALVARSHKSSDLIVGLGVLGIPALYFFYWHSGFYPGPRFYYAAAPFLLLGTARAWHWGLGLARRMRNPHLNLPAGLYTAAVITVVWGWLGVLPARIGVYREGLRTMKLHPERALAQAGVARALVLVPESWASRTIVDLWSLGVPPGLTERAFRRLDTCDLYRFADGARRATLEPAETTARLRSRVDGVTVAAPRVPDAPDPWIRLRHRDSLPASCRRELERDYKGFTLYGNLGWRNDIELASGVLFARDLYERNDALLRRYPGWEVWRYAPPAGEPGALPRLVRIRPGRDATDGRDGATGFP